MSVLSNTGIRMGASAAGGDATKYVEEVFSTDLYDGVDSPSAITVDNGIDLTGEGGMVWFARRSHAQWHGMFDTERGTEKVIYSDQTSVEGTNTGSLTAFNDDGFTIGTHTHINDDDGFGNTTAHVAWTFRKAPGFFDVVKWEGNGTAGRQIEHNLGCKPGAIWVKNLTNGNYWATYHKLQHSSAPENYGMTLADQWAIDDDTYWNDTAPTATHFTVGDKDSTNKNGHTHVAYLFADGDEADAQIFGEDEDESIIKCGSYTGNGTSGHIIDVGFEPQWIIIKSTSSGMDWAIFDNMRGICDTSDGWYLLANSATIEYGSKFAFRANGFGLFETAGPANNNGQEFTYIAIRRGPMKTPEDATKVFAIDAGGNTTDPLFTAPFPADCLLHKIIDSTGDWSMSNRFTGPEIMKTNTNDTASDGLSATWDHMGGAWNGWSGSSNRNGWMFRRAPGFFDVVAYNGTGSIKTESHNLGVVPEMMVMKCRTAVEHWAVYHKDLSGANYYVRFSQNNAENTNSGMWNTTAPTASVFTVGGDNETNNVNEKMLAYLFASCPGVSKVGTYTGTGSEIDIDCGFTGGARFVLIKRTDDSGNWMLYDTTRGIVSGNDPYIRLNSTQAQTTDEDHIDPHNPGFTVTTHADVNTSGGTYIYLAIA